MAVPVISVKKGSPAAGVRISPGDVLLSINGHVINDVLDYGFYSADQKLSLEIRTPSGKTRAVRVNKSEYDELGIESETFLMDEQHSCTNKCIFCFIDQLPPGMRKSLYFKDDDERLSFLFGNYVTMTNMSDDVVRRIIDMHITPINISVHTTDPLLRCEMMSNRFAGEKLKYLRWLADAGIEMNLQLVLCRGINDGEYLLKSLRDLGELYPAVRSIACVPAGLTAFREKLPDITPYDAESSAEVLEIIEDYRTEAVKKGFPQIVYPADEFFLMTGREIPESGYYGDMLQLENGVGMIAQFREEFYNALDDTDIGDSHNASTVITGEASFAFINTLVDAAKARFPDLEINTICIKNNYFGGNVSVSGLLTAHDIIEQATGRIFCTAILPANTLRSDGDMFLDSVTTDELANKLGCALRFDTDGNDFLNALLGF